MSYTTLPQAPGAGAAKTTGILSIVFGILCFPVGLVLAIVALVQHSKAKNAYAAHPETFEPVSGTGLITGIIGLLMPLVLAIVGIIAAIAIPAMLGQRGRARDMAAKSTMTSAMTDLVAEYDRQVEQKTPREAIPSALGTKLRTLGADTKNPWDPASPAFSYSIAVVNVTDTDVLLEAAKTRATEKGVSVFVISLPDPSAGSTGYLVGAVRLQAPSNGKDVYTKTVTLE